MHQIRLIGRLNRFTTANRGQLRCYGETAPLTRRNNSRIRHIPKRNEIELSNNEQQLGTRWSSLGITSGVIFTAICSDVFHPSSLHLLADLDQGLHQVSLSLDPSIRVFFQTDVSMLAILASSLGWLGASVAHLSELPNLIRSEDSREKEDYIRATLVLFLSWIFFALMTGDHGSIVGSLKDFFERSRPSPVLPSFSFPSGHTAAASFLSLDLMVVILPTVIPSLSHLWRRCAWPVFLFSYALTASGRVLGDAHWFSDTLASLFLSIAVVSVLVEVKGFVQQKGDEKLER